jgi:hypothetical protein
VAEATLTTKIVTNKTMAAMAIIKTQMMMTVIIIELQAQNKKVKLDCLVLSLLTIDKSD